MTDTKGEGAKGPRPIAKLETAHDYLRRYPRVCAHIIAESLGYAVPMVAASILQHAEENKPHYCEWIDACYRGDPRPAVEGAIRNRHTHSGYMASYDLAYRIVRRELDEGESPMFASWF